MRAIVVRCPNCGANLKVEATVASVKCQYCDTVSRIQARTAVFQVPKPVPPPKQPQQHRMPVAKQQFSWLRMIPFVALIGFIAGGIFIAKQAHRAVTGQLHWVGRVPLLLDVDGDQVPDPIGIVFYPMDNGRAHYAAFSAKTGGPLWESEALGSFSDLGQQVMAVAGELFLIASDRGTLSARDRTGKQVWQLPFSEKIDEICRGPAPGEVAIMTADKKWFVVDAKGQRRDGTKLLRFDHDYSTDTTPPRFVQVTAEAAPDLCMPISDSTWKRNPGTLTLPRWHDLVKVEGMHVDRYIRRPGGPIIGVGYKSPGTNVKMLAGTDGKRALWTAEIPAVDPLVASVDEKLVTLTDQHILALYQPKSPNKPRLTAFDIATGKRLWDVEIEPGQHSFTPGAVLATGDVALVSTYQGLRAHALADGKLLWSVGSR